MYFVLFVVENQLAPGFRRGISWARFTLDSAKCPARLVLPRSQASPSGSRVRDNGSRGASCRAQVRAPLRSGRRRSLSPMFRLRAQNGAHRHVENVVVRPPAAHFTFCPAPWGTTRPAPSTRCQSLFKTSNRPLRGRALPAGRESRLPPSQTFLQPPQNIRKPPKNKMRPAPSLRLAIRLPRSKPLALSVFQRSYPTPHLLFC